MKVKAYAKINLGLKVLGERDDGFHELDMLMINVGVFDVLNFKKNKEVVINTNKPVCKMEDNIVYKAVMLIKKLYNVEEGIKIYIRKRIPDGGGMGGGSSDAAVTIKALNKIWDLQMTKDDMSRIAEQLGSDVPFFIENCFSRVSGRGEKVKPLQENIDSKILLAFPDMKCSTKYIFDNYKKNDKNYKIEDICFRLDNDYYKYLFNDLEETVFRLYPEYILIDAKKEIEKNFDCKVLMSGSGASFFVLGKDLKKAYKHIKEKYPKLNVIKNKTISSCKSGIQ